MCGGGPTGVQPGALPGRGLNWSLFLLIAVVAALAIWIAWRRRWFQKRTKPAAAPALAAIRLDAEDLTADRLPEESWLELAARSLQEGNFRFALRAYYLANLAWLGRSQFLTIHPGKTANREYEKDLASSAKPVTFSQARELFTRKYRRSSNGRRYGQHEVGPVDAEQFPRTDGADQGRTRSAAGGGGVTWDQLVRMQARRTARVS